MQSLGKLGRAEGHVSPLGCAKFHISFKFDVICASCSAKSWCLYVFFFTLRGRRVVRSSVTYFQQVLCRGLWVNFDTVYTFFSALVALS